MKSMLQQLDAGWVEVVPYNDQLIFLKGKNGTYDFVFDGMKDDSFNHNPYEPYLKNADVPNTEKEYDFKRWLYFPKHDADKKKRVAYTGWEEMDRHKAEVAFYASGGISKNYLGYNDIFREYRTGNGEYQPLKEQADLAGGFTKMNINGKAFAVSDLITISEFKGFMETNELYAHYSRKPVDVDDWKTVNTDDPRLPASVTWYDAMAYTAWVSKGKPKFEGKKEIPQTKGIPVRLLNENEYRVAAKCLLPNDASSYFEAHIDSHPDHLSQVEHQERFEKAWSKRLCDFSFPDGTPIDGHPPYMEENDFQSMVFKYNLENIEWKKSDAGLKFLHSPYFGEWLQPKAAAIGSFLLASLQSTPSCMVSATRERFSPRSSGKYKSRKIGFRMIYELNC
ncbi:SUMF1/EgtB/PvdO family nonheme iron enzyme [Terasakiella sp.]|uniref:SUMF1/EgtB/PvdO family nonheme iron enzyme n=1 Tax=Terasakiella sp. TaxID=2034861 RepID=UPI003AA97FBE